MKDKPKLTRARSCIQLVNGGTVSVKGCVDLPLHLCNLTVNHRIYVAEGINRNLILGRDFPKRNGVRKYFDLGYFRIGKTYIRLEEDIHISSLLRLTKKTLLKPKTKTVCSVKVNKGFFIPKEGVIEISEIKKDT